MSHLNSIQKLLVGLSIFSLVVFISINVYITFNSASVDSVLGVNVSETQQQYEVQQFNHNNKSQSKHKSGVLIESTSTSTFKSKDITLTTENSAFTFLPNENVYIENGAFLFELNDLAAIQIKSTTLKSIGKSQVLVSVKGFDIKIYVLEGAISTNEGDIAEVNQQLTWLVDQFGTLNFSNSDFKKEPLLLDFFYALSEVDLLPTKLSEFKPSI